MKIGKADGELLCPKDGAEYEWKAEYGQRKLVCKECGIQPETTPEGAYLVDLVQVGNSTWLYWPRVKNLELVK